MKKLLSLLLALLPLWGAAQVRYPVTVSGFTVQPRIFVSDYLLAGSGNLRAGFTFGDLSESSREVFLHLTIESSTAKLESDPQRQYKPIVLGAGELLQISDVDFTEYLSFDNMLFRGVDKSTVVRSGRLPEGFYTFSLQVLDYRTREVISNAAKQSVMLKLNPTPALFYPRSGAVIPCDVAQNMLFQWQLNSPFVTPLNTTYTLSLYEVNEDAQYPQAAIANGQVRQVYVSEPSAELSRLYSAFEPLLECGKRYAYTITAADVDGRDVFKNGGVSEVGWFYFGYPNNGSIPLIYPPNGGAFAISSRKTLRWGGSDKFLPDQPVSYSIKMVELAEGEDASEAMSKPAFYEDATRESRQHEGGTLELSGLGNAKLFAWQVKATTGQQEVAQSAVYSFMGAPLVEEFYAGTHLLRVVRAQGTFDKLSGEAEVVLDKSGKTYTIPFKNISLASANGIYLLNSAIVNPIPKGFGNITLAAKIERNGEATFFPDSLRIDPQGLAMHGHVTWAYPFAVDAKEKPYVRSKMCWAAFNDLTLSGNVELAPGNDFALLEPMNFTMSLYEASRFIFDQNTHRLWFRGHIVTPANIKGVKEQTYRLYFQDFEQLFYNTVSGYACGNKTYTIPNTNLLLHPQVFTVDLDETQSSGKLSGNPDWRGIYYDKFTVEYPATLDEMRQVIPTQLISHRFEEPDSTYAYLQASGLMLGIFDRGFGDGEVAGFNTFPSVFNEWRLVIENSKVKSGHLKGTIRLPLISQTLRYPYTVPISNLGLQTGYLDESLDNTTFEHNPDGGEQHISITIRRAVFAGRNRLVMDVDMSYHFLKTTFSGLQGLTTWGHNYDIGFSTPSGTMALTHQKTAMVKGFETTFDHVGAGRNGNLYAVGVSGKMNMGEDVTGAGGPPIANFYSTLENDLLSGVPATGGPAYENVPVANNEGKGLTPVGDVGVPVEGQEVVVDLRIEGFAEQNAQMDELRQISEEYGEKLEVDTASKPLFMEPIAPKSTSQNQIINTIEKVNITLDIIIFIANFLDELEEDGNNEYSETVAWIAWARDYIDQANPQEIQRYIDFASNINELKAHLLNSLIAKLTAQLKDPMQQQEQEIQSLISSKMDSLSKAAMAPVGTLMEKAFEGARPPLAALAGKHADVADKALSSAKLRVTAEVTKAVQDAIDTEITGSINGLIHNALFNRIYGLIDSIVSKQLTLIANGKAPSVDDMSKDIQGTLSGAGNDVLKFISFDNIASMLKRTAATAWNNIDFAKIIEEITKDVIGKSLGEYASDQLTKLATDKVTDLLGESAGATAGSIAAAVHMDFNALAKGDFKNAVRFDPSAIIIYTPVAEISGYVRFVEDDPIWGKSWQAMLNAKVLVPKPFPAYVSYINGTMARPDGSTFKFWIIDIGVSKLGLSLTPLPIVMDAAKGKAYQHVRRDPASNTYAPAEEVRFGVNLDANFLDQSGGSVAFFDVGLGATIMDKGFILEIYGKVDAANVVTEDKDGNIALQKSVVKGTGRFTYSSLDGTFLGRSDVKVDAGPLMCAKGSLDIAITKSSFLFALGTRQQPVQLDVLCRNKPVLNGWFALSSASLDLGAFINIDERLETGWMGGGCAKIKPWAHFRFNSGFSTLVYWSPLKIAEASIWLDMYAGIGVKYDFCLKEGNLTIAEVGLGGELRYVADPESIISGKMHGRITVLSVGFGVDFSASVKL